MTTGKKKDVCIDCELRRMRDHYEAGIQAGYEAGYVGARSLFERKARKNPKESP